LSSYQNVAVALNQYVYIYDSLGKVVHCLKEHHGARKLEFLPKHMLLASVGQCGLLCYQDISTGSTVAKIKSSIGSYKSMCQNQSNAMINLGHTNGTISMWSPNNSTPVLKISCHRGSIQTITNDPTGNIIVTTGFDCQIKVWDIRTFKILHQYFSKSLIKSSKISQNGLLALACGNHVQIWKDPFTKKQESPFMNHKLSRGSLREVAFCPYEDFLAIGHSDGVESMIVPGSGEPNFDSYVSNPFKRNSRKNYKIKNQIEKLNPDTIGLNPETIREIEKLTKINSKIKSNISASEQRNSKLKVNFIG